MGCAALGALGYAMLKKMKCYSGGAHPHTSSKKHWKFKRSSWLKLILRYGSSKSAVARVFVNAVVQLLSMASRPTLLLSRETGRMVVRQPVWMVEHLKYRSISWLTLMAAVSLTGFFVPVSHGITRH